MNLKTDFLWVQKYRPKSFSNLILPERLKSMFKNMADSKVIPSMLFSGGPGSGKTTTAGVFVEETGWESMKINTSDERGIDTVRSKLRSYCRKGSADGNPKFVILEEADNMTIQMQSAMRYLIEEYSKNTIFIFTANYPDRIIPAIRDSRLKEISFDFTEEEIDEMKPLFKARMMKILEKEGVEVEGDKGIKKLIRKLMPDMRNILKSLQTVAIENAKREDDKVKLFIPEMFEAHITVLNYDSFLETINSGDYKEYYKFVKSYSPESIFRLVEDNLDKVDEAKVFDVLNTINFFDAQNATNLMKSANMVEFMHQVKKFIK